MAQTKASKKASKMVEMKATMKASKMASLMVEMMAETTASLMARRKEQQMAQMMATLTYPSQLTCRISQTLASLQSLVTGKSLVTGILCRILASLQSLPIFLQGSEHGALFSNERLHHCHRCQRRHWYRHTCGWCFPPCDEERDCQKVLAQQLQRLHRDGEVADWKPECQKHKEWLALPWP